MVDFSRSGEAPEEPWRGQHRFSIATHDLEEEEKTEWGSESRAAAHAERSWGAHSLTAREEEEKTERGEDLEGLVKEAAIPLQGAQSSPAEQGLSVTYGNARQEEQGALYRSGPPGEEAGIRYGSNDPRRQPETALQGYQRESQEQGYHP